MKLKNYLLNKSFFVFIFFFIIIFHCSITQSNEISEKKLLIEISKELRCMTCQSQTIHESESDFSKQIKNEVLDQIKQKKTKKEIIDFMVKRYGEYIVFKPKFDKKNLVLWVSPFILLFLLSLLNFSINLLISLKSKKLS